jgi:hypothetical protein
VNYRVSVGHYPETIEESLSAAISDRYDNDKSCCVPGSARDEIVAQVDGWGRKLEFRATAEGDRLISVAVISGGANGVMNYGRDVKSDDVVGHIYLERARRSKEDR